MKSPGGADAGAVVGVNEFASLLVVPCARTLRTLFSIGPTASCRLGVLLLIDPAVRMTKAQRE